MVRSARSLFALLALGGLAACSKSGPHAASAPADHAHAAPGHGHEHVPPHGGTAVVLGRERYHLELVRNASTGRLTAYVLDGHLENFVRVSAPSIEISATVDGATRLLVLTATANPATGESVGDTAQFDTQADWLKTTPSFAAALVRLDIRGTVFSAVPFSFPQGNDTD